MTRIWNKHKQTNTPLKRKVFVGLSGGVDSSTSAALLKRGGYDVTGVFIKVWNPSSEQDSTLPAHSKLDEGGNRKKGRTLFDSCQMADDRLDAMRVCAHLKIPFKELNLEKEYKREVVDYMIREYKLGRTPNPDVMCNRHIKFGAFFDWALAHGADYVATGHYARVASDATREAPNHKSQAPNKSQTLNPKRYTLNASIDKNKDQSYFLWTLTQKQLAKTLFPVGGMKKPEVRKLAKKFGLLTAEKKDSQGLCFIGKVDMKEFLKRYIKPKRGNVLNARGEKIGEHDGAFFLTLGERHGFRITRKRPNDRPCYVVAKDIEKNTIVVSHKSSSGKLAFARKTVFISDENWIREIPKLNVLYQARLRYRQKLESCRIRRDKNGAKAIFSRPQNSVTMGQSLVLYKGSECLGGGIISS